MMRIIVILVGLICCLSCSDVASSVKSVQDEHFNLTAYLDSLESTFKYPVEQYIESEGQDTRLFRDTSDMVFLLQTLKKSDINNPRMLGNYTISEQLGRTEYIAKDSTFRVQQLLVLGKKPLPRVEITEKVVNLLNQDVRTIVIDPSERWISIRKKTTSFKKAPIQIQMRYSF